ncbi:MAG: TolC family protein [Lentisphaeraceae bacterium]|nr:TolC family protein [Lentisphaeraceae bacterium]
MKSKKWLLIFIPLIVASCKSKSSFYIDADDSSFLDQPISAEDNFDNVPKVIDAKTSLNDLLKYAALNNAALKSAYLKWQSELFKIYPAGSLPDPVLSYTYYIQEVETRVGPQKNALGLMQKLPWFGKLDLKEAMQRDAAKSKKAEYDAVKNSLFSKVEQLYYDYWYLQQSQRITEENVKLLESLEPIVRNKIKTGDGSQDLIKLQIEIGKITDINENLKLRKIPLDARLNQLLNRPSNAKVELVAILGKLSEDTSEDVLLVAIRNNPGMQKFDFLKSGASKKVDLTDKGRYPDFTVGLKWIQTDPSFANTKENGKDPVMATVGFTVPWDQKKYDQLVAAEKMNYRSINWAQREYRNSLEARLKTALFEIEDNQRVLKLYQDTLIPKTEESLNLSMQAYRNAKESFIGFVDIQRQLLNFQLILEKARKNIAVQRSIIEEITGQKLSPKAGLK